MRYLRLQRSQSNRRRAEREAGRASARVQAPSDPESATRDNPVAVDPKREPAKRKTD